MKLSHELLKAILVQTPPEEDRRNFFVRLFTSLKFGVKLSYKKGKVARFFRVGGGADF
jgi:hypothetical protein